MIQIELLNIGDLALALQIGIPANDIEFIGVFHTGRNTSDQSDIVCTVDKLCSQKLDRIVRKAGVIGHCLIIACLCFLGTKAAVELAINSLYEEASVAEWFEYDGDPYHFRVIIHSDETIADSTKLLTVISKIIYYKNLRSTLDDILFTRTHEMPMRYVGTAVYASTYTTLTLDTVIDPTNYNWLQDEQSVMLLDEMGDVLLNDA